MAAPATAPRTSAVFLPLYSKASATRINRHIFNRASANEQISVSSRRGTSGTTRKPAKHRHNCNRPPPTNRLGISSRQKAEGRGQWADGRRRRGKAQKAEGGRHSAYCLLPTAYCR